jgi:hypothetical protein
MDTRIAPGGTRLDVIATDSATRVTPPSGVPFQDILASGAGALLRGAQAAVTALPGAPIVAAAIRPGGSASPVSTASAISSPSMGLGLTGTSAGISPVNAPGISTPAIQGTAESPTGTAASGSTETSSVEGALAQSQQFNLYYLQLQEQLSAENRAYSAMSNVLKARHDTVKNAIGNIR